VLGSTLSTDFPITPGAFDPSHNGSWDVFVAQLSPSGGGLVYATFLGGDNDDEGYDIALDRTGYVYVIGETLSAGFPTTPGAFDTA